MKIKLPKSVRYWLSIAGGLLVIIGSVYRVVGAAQDLGGTKTFLGIMLAVILIAGVVAAVEYDDEFGKGGPS